MGVSGACQYFHATVSRIEALQVKINAASSYDEDDLDILYESAFLQAYRGFENFLEKAFLMYMIGERTASGNVLSVNCTPRDLEHARSMLIGQAPFLDWTKTSVIISRCETWFQLGNDRFKTGIASKQSLLGYAKDLRNHIAHNSNESGVAFQRLVGSLHVVMPEAGMRAGALLRTVPSKGPAKDTSVLQYFLDGLRDSANYIAES